MVAVFCPWASVRQGSGPLTSWRHCAPKVTSERRMLGYSDLLRSCKATAGELAFDDTSRMLVWSLILLHMDFFLHALLCDMNMTHQDRSSIPNQEHKRNQEYSAAAGGGWFPVIRHDTPASSQTISSHYWASTRSFVYCFTTVVITLHYC